MTNIRKFTEDERTLIDERIDHFFAFLQDVLDDPSTLDHVPDEATIELTPVEAKQKGRRYLTESRRFAVSLESDPDQGKDHRETRECQVVNPREKSI